MVTPRRTNILVYAIARILTGLCSFLGFRGPAWARRAVEAGQEPVPTTKETELPALGRAAASVEHPAPHKKARKTVSKARRAGAKKAPKKIASHRAARERTESARSSL